MRAAAARLLAAAMNLKPATLPPTDTYCALLELPAEMRNRIYQYALIDSDCVTLTHENCTQPALLRTCRQTRTEASGIFYSANKFQLEACSPLRTRGLPQVQHWLWTIPGREEFDVKVKCIVEWEPFMCWLQLIHRGAIHVKRVYAGYQSLDRLLKEALSIARDYKGLPWSVTAYQLQDFRQRKVRQYPRLSAKIWWS